eukprot:7972578-Pyramimonas_sp.AAC.1
MWWPRRSSKGAGSALDTVTACPIELSAPLDTVGTWGSDGTPLKKMLPVDCPCTPASGPNPVRRPQRNRDGVRARCRQRRSSSSSGGGGG